MKRGVLSIGSKLAGGRGRARSFWLASNGHLLTSKQDSASLADYILRLHFSPGHSTIAVDSSVEFGFLLSVQTADGRREILAVAAASASARDEWVAALRSVGWAMAPQDELVSATAADATEWKGTGWDPRTHRLAAVPSAAAAQLPLSESAYLEEPPPGDGVLGDDYDAVEMSALPPGSGVFGDFDFDGGDANAARAARAATTTETKAETGAATLTVALAGTASYWRGTGWDARTHELAALPPSAPAVTKPPSDPLLSAPLPVDEYADLPEEADVIPSWRSRSRAAAGGDSPLSSPFGSSPLSSSERSPTRSPARAPFRSTHTSTASARSLPSSLPLSFDGEEEQLTPHKLRWRRKELLYGTYQVSPHTAKLLRAEALEDSRLREVRQRLREAERRFEAVSKQAAYELGREDAMREAAARAAEVAAAAAASPSTSAIDAASAAAAVALPVVIPPSDVARHVHIDRAGVITIDGVVQQSSPRATLSSAATAPMTTAEKRLAALFADAATPPASPSDGGGFRGTSGSGIARTSAAQSVAQDALAKSASAEVIQRLAQLRVRMDDRLASLGPSGSHTALEWQRSSRRAQRRAEDKAALVAEAERKEAELHNGRTWNAHTLLATDEDPVVSPRPTHPEKAHSPAKEAYVSFSLAFQITSRPGRVDRILNMFLVSLE